MSEITLILIIAMAVYFAFKGWKFFSAKLMAYEKEKQATLVVKKLISSFPEYAADFIKMDAAQIFKAMDRREEDFKEASTKQLEVETAREKATGKSDPEWRWLEPDDWPRSSYFGHFLPKDFCDEIDRDVSKWRQFIVCVWNAYYEGAGARLRYVIGEDGKIHFTDANGVSIFNKK